MFKEVPLILSAPDIIERSIKKSSKIQKTDKNPHYKKKKTIIARTESFSNNIISSLEQYVKKFPSINNLPTFYQDIIDIKIDINKLKKSLGAVDWARKTCQMIYSKQSKSLKKTNNVEIFEGKHVRKQIILKKKVL